MPELVQPGVIEHVSLLGVVVLEGVALQRPRVPLPVHLVLGQDDYTTSQRQHTGSTATSQHTGQTTGQAPKTSEHESNHLARMTRQQGCNDTRD